MDEESRKENAGEKIPSFQPNVNLALTGFMGSGKTTVGQLLARWLGREFFDTDEMIMESMEMSINDIFAARGEDFFRNKETEVLRHLGERAPGTCVVATGGGAVLRAENRKSLRKNGLIVYLDVPAGEIYRRLKDKKDRPLLNVREPQEKIKHLLQQRKPFYLQADLCIPAGDKSPQEIAVEIMGKLEKCYEQERARREGR